MTEKFLYDSEVGAPVEKVGCKAVTQRVRVRRRHCAAIQEAPDITGTESVSSDG